MSFLGEGGGGAEEGVVGKQVSPALVMDASPRSLIRTPITVSASLPMEHPGLATRGIFPFKDGDGKNEKRKSIPRCGNAKT